MSNHSKKGSAETRANHSKWLRNRTGRKAGILAEGVLPVPLIPIFWPGEPEFAEYVPRDQQAVDMFLNIPSWERGAPDSSESDTLTLEWKPATDAIWGTIRTTPIQGPVVPGDLFPQTLEKRFFSQPGTYNLRYRVRTWNNIIDSSATQNIIIDQAAPNYGGESPNPLTFKDPALETDGVTDEYLVANGKVTMVVPPYHDEQPGDTVDLFIYGNIPDPNADPVFSGSIDTTLREADIPATRIRSLPDGRLFVIYRLRDKVGNTGNDSKEVGTELFVKPFPIPPLAAPKVPLAEDPQELIDLDDVRNPGVLVTVARYTNWLDGDILEIDWGGFKFTYPVGAAPAETILIPVPWDTALKPAYGSGTTGPKPTVIRYDVVRGSKRFPSGSITINVDLSVAGPEPEEPGPINPDLARVTVRGTGASPEDNVLNADDAGLPATASVAIYDPFAAGERMSLYWGSLPDPVDTYDPDPANDAAGDIITFDIPWVEIEKEPGATDLPVYYSLTFIAGGNSQRSPDQLVDITGALPISFATPEFPDAATTEGGRPILNCDSFIPPDHHVLLKIPGNNPLLVGGESVEVTWQGYSDFLGTVPSGTPWTDSRTITAAQARDGYELRVQPYADHIEPVGSYGSVRVTYTADVDGKPVSGSALIWASSTSAGGACVLTP